MGKRQSRHLTEKCKWILNLKNSSILYRKGNANDNYIETPFPSLIIASAGEAVGKRAFTCHWWACKMAQAVRGGLGAAWRWRAHWPLVSETLLGTCSEDAGKSSNAKCTGRLTEGRWAGRVRWGHAHRAPGCRALWTRHLAGTRALSKPGLCDA